MSREPSPWRVLSSRELLAAPPVLRLSVDTVELPDGRVIDDFYQLRLRNFVNVYAETVEGRVLVIRQYKHGARRVGLTLPGGHIDPGEPPLDAVKRELMEETGYQAESWVDVGPFVTNLNQGGSHGHVFIARGCRKLREPDPGDLEDMQVLELTPAELFAAAARGDFLVFEHVGLVALATNPAFMAALEGRSAG